MVDSGATSVFIHKKLVKEFNLETKKLEKPHRLKVIDGRDISSGQVDTTCTIKIEIADHVETLECFVVDVGTHDIVLGMS